MRDRQAAFSSGGGDRSTIVTRDSNCGCCHTATLDHDQLRAIVIESKSLDPLLVSPFLTLQ
ncbi:hypothetical protein CBOM_07537 [Ceraceosorus bombacis]|uniref:Uncharacterized protein n=1 Tax=Ceraceosorus bombacis TaxID=401625 RepID=A0A0P1BG07_9BASI|nr:hypothetical protein CBOM_07537 [Ceraceosorus bombacis]